MHKAGLLKHLRISHVTALLDILQTAEAWLVQSKSLATNVEPAYNR